MIQKGKFVISLDFELLWGVRDKKTIDSYGTNIKNVWDALPKTLEIFKENKISATFATVGFLFASNKNELNNFFPELKPKYIDKNLSPYNGHLNLVKENESLDKYHYASELIKLIGEYSNQEIGSHTFSHYYCLENGQNINEFKEDMQAAIKIANNKNITLNSLVFPRNQFNKEYIKVCKNLNISSYRGNEKNWIYNASKGKDESKVKRLFRLLDSYINISGYNTYKLNEVSKEYPYNIPSSRFLRPYSKKFKYFEKIRLKRILKAMTFAAKNNELFHLWWHPHNFGSNQKENFGILNKILKHYQILNEKYNFESINMSNLADELKNE